VRTRSRLRIVLVCIVPLLAAATPAMAQEPPRDCAPVPDSSRVLRSAPGRLLQTMTLFIVAPSALLLLAENPCPDEDDPRPASWRNYVAVYGTGGFAVTGDWRGGVASAGGVELMVRGVYAEARVDRYGISDGVRMWDARAGYLVRPFPEVAGGVTVGYRQVRDAPDAWTQGGVMVGFPFVLAGCSERNPCWFHWEPTYLLTGDGLAVSPRARVDVSVPRTPLVARLEFESRGVRHGDPMALSIGFGLRP
jgi:hypothetical protein